MPENCTIPFFPFSLFGIISDQEKRYPGHLLYVSGQDLSKTHQEMEEKERKWRKYKPPASKSENKIKKKCNKLPSDRQTLEKWSV